MKKSQSLEHGENRDLTQNDECNVGRRPRTRGQLLDPSIRNAAEQSLSTDLGDVRVHDGSEAQSKVEEHDALALTIGSNIYLGTPVRNDRNPIMAHELAHVAQQQEGAQPRTRTAAASESTHEQEADLAAEAIMVGKKAAVTSAPVQPAAFAPKNHRKATVDGLHRDFSVEEIGMIFASNWERDFSQSCPEIATVMTTWKAVKESAHMGPPLSIDGGGAFRGAIATLVSTPVPKLLSADNQAYGGYQPWEHMDGALSGEAKKNAEKRWAEKNRGLEADQRLPGYLNDGIASVKDEMVAAVNSYREAKDLEKVDEPDNWEGGEKPTAMLPKPPTADDPFKVVEPSHKGGDGAKAPDTSTVRDEAQKQAEAKGVNPYCKMTAEEEAMWKEIADHLGRAMHAFEDFWSHSNWVELCLKMKKPRPEKATMEDPLQLGFQAKNSDLRLAEFDTTSQAHAFGHKIDAAMGSLIADHDLVMKVYEESTAGEPSDETLRPVDPNERGPTLMERVSEHYQGKVATPDNIREFMTNKDAIATLKIVSKALIDYADDKGDEHSHAKMAKDQEEDGKPAALATAVAAAANEQVFGPLRKIMGEKDPKKATQTINSQLQLVDQMCAAPSPNHPLWWIVLPPKQ